MEHTCESCDQTYQLRFGNTRIFVFIEDPYCNHLRLNCPQCSNVESILVDADGLIEAKLAVSSAPIAVAARASDEIQRLASVWRRLKTSADDDLPVLPRDMARDIADFCRKFADYTGE